MSYQEKVRFIDDERRTIDRGCYIELDGRDWADWMKDRLHGEDHLVRYLPDDLPHVAFVYLAREVSDVVKEAVHSGIRLCLDSAYESLANQGSNWRNEGIDELFLLVNSVGYEEGDDENKDDDPHPFYQDAENIRRFLDVIQPRPELVFTRSSEQTESDLYFRVLQTLVGIRAELPYQFWEEKLSHSSDKYSYVCVRGAEYNSLDDAMRLLHQVDWRSENTKTIMGNYFNLFFLEHGIDSTEARRLDEEKKKLPKDARKIIDGEYQLMVGE